MKAIFAFSVAMLAGSMAFAQEPDVAKGEKLFKLWCVACHGEGPGHPGTQALSKLYEGSDTPAVIAQRQDLDLDIIMHFVRNGTSIMPFFRKTELSDTDVADIAAYIKKNSGAE